MNRLAKAIAVCAGIMFLLGGSVSATQILLSQSNGEFGYGYGFYNWDNMTSYLNTESGYGITTVSNFENYSQMAGFDALWLDQRWTGGTLSSTEIANITAFAATGKKVVLIGENNNWTTWNEQILSITGGTFGGNFSGNANAIVNNEITAGVLSRYLPASGIVATGGGTALFDQNFATLWKGNVLTVLDINVLDDVYSGRASNDQFARNIAKWISTPTSNVPEPSSMVLMFMGIVWLATFRKRK